MRYENVQTVATKINKEQNVYFVSFLRCRVSNSKPGARKINYRQENITIKNIMFCCLPAHWCYNQDFSAVGPSGPNNKRIVLSFYTMGVLKL